jgi:hypothetical protein
MINNIIILDDVVSKPYQDYIQKAIMESNVPWMYRPNLGNDTPIKKDNDTQAAPGIIHVVTNQHGVQSELFYTVLPIVEMACQKINFPITAVIGGRTFIQFPAIKDIGFTKIHTDLDIDHLVCLYYVIDSDGDTVLFDKTTSDIPKSQVKESDLTVVKRISPKKGRAVLFNGNRYHCTTLPLNSQRCVINFNIC